MSKDLQELIKNKELTREQKNKILLTAAREGNLEIIRQAIEELGADVNATTRGGHTSFIVAANRGHIKVIEELYVNYGADVNAVANDGWTALRYVVQCGGNLEVVRALLSCKDIDVNITDKYNKAPLLIALRNGRSEISKLLIEHPSNRMSQEQKNEVLLTAAEEGNLEIIRKAIEELGADVNATNREGSTPLIIAATYGHLEVVKACLGYGANINHQGSYNDTVLHEALRKGHKGIAEYLINVEDINLNLQNEEGKTPLHSSVIYEYSDIVKLLTEKGSDFNIQDTFGETALDLAIRRGHKEITILLEAAQRANEILLTAAEEGNLEIIREAIEELGANVNAKDKNGNTALILAARKGHLEVVKACLGYGASINYQGRYNDTALHEALENGHESIAEYLINAKDIDLNLHNDEYQTPLHYSVIYEYSDIVSLLIKKGADLSIQDMFGETALDLAIEYGHGEIITQLESAQRAPNPLKRKIEVEVEGTVASKQARVEKATEKVAEKAAKPSKRKIEVKGEETVVTSKQPRLEKIRVEKAVTEILGGLSLK